MAQVSATQLATWSAAAGIGGQDQAVSVAIALAAGADPAGPVGAWGIGGGGDGQQQANAMAARFKASGWTTFPTHQTGRFLFYMPTATAVIQPVPQGPASSVIGSAIAGAELISPALRNLDNVARGVGQTASGAVQGAVSDVAAPFLVPIKFLEDPQTWVRIVKIITGGALIIIAGVKFGLDNVFGGPLRMMDRAGDEVANRASVVGLFGGPTGRVAAGTSVAIHNHPQPPSTPPTARTPRRTTARKRTPPPAESPRVAEAKRLLREADQEKRAKREKEAE